MSYKMTESHRKKISDSNKGKKMSLDACNKMSESKKRLKTVPPSNKGKVFTSDHRAKISQSLKGNVGLGWMKGLQHKPETRKKISDALKGEKGSNWQNGRTKSNTVIRQCFMYNLWRESVFKRDAFACKDCGKTNCYVEAHHIKKFSKIISENKITNISEAQNCSELWDINNGITLCKECHNKTKTIW